MQHKDFATLVADDISVVLTRGMSTINFYVDTFMSDFTGQGEALTPKGVERKLRFAIKVPSNTLLAVATILPKIAKKLKEKPEINDYWIHVDKRSGKPRKPKDVLKGRLDMPSLEEIEG